MADENLTNDAEELASEVEEQAAEAAEQAVEATEQVEETLSEAVETEAEEAVAETAPLLDELETANEKAEAAVQHVAEEAAADAAAEAETVEEAPAPKKRERRSKQARAEKASKQDVVPAATNADAPKAAGLGMPAWIGICVASLVLGLLLGRFVLGGGAGGSDIAGKTSVTEAELDKAYASYTYGGKTTQITVREVIEQNGTIDAALDEEGNYTLPSAEYAMNAARTAILNSEIESRGIEVSEEDAAAYAEKALGTSDYDAIASTYGMDAEAVKKLVMDNCRLDALRKEVVGEDLPEMPEAPEAPEEGSEDKATKKYADYIITLVGEEWDAKAGAWASEDSPYATALDGYGFNGKTASYNAAQAAYYVAYQQYSEKQAEMSSKWTEFLNGLLSNATIQVGSLIS